MLETKIIGVHGNPPFLLDYLFALKYSCLIIRYIYIYSPISTYHCFARTMCLLNTSSTSYQECIYPR
jgi:hypothetical protein